MATTEITVAQPVKEGLTIDQLKYRQQQIHKLLDEVLQEGIDNDYAVIPGTQKRTLLKPGAEKICNLFQFVPTLPRIEEFRDGNDVTFRVTVALSHANGMLLGEGIGQASTKETKFAWRKAICEDEYFDVEPDQRRKKWFVDRNTSESGVILQVRENPADKENNMLKIAKKRGLIDAVLTITGASNLFTQDREEEIQDGGNGNGESKKQATTAKIRAVAADAKADQGPVVEPKAAGRFYYVWSKDRTPPRSPEEVKLYLQRICGVSDSRQMPEKFFKEACRWAASNEPVPDAKPAAAAAPAAPAEEKAKLTPQQEEAKTAFGILGWDIKTQDRFAEQYAYDWNKIVGELKILVMKRDEKEKF